MLVFFISELKTKLLALSKEKDCDIIQPWMKSIINHLYWTAASSPDQDRVLMLAKQMVLCNHIINVHNGHSPLYASCEHGELEDRESQKNWLKPGIVVCLISSVFQLTWPKRPCDLLPSLVQFVCFTHHVKSTLKTSNKWQKKTMTLNNAQHWYFFLNLNVQFLIHVITIKANVIFLQTQ